MGETWRHAYGIDFIFRSSVGESDGRMQPEDDLFESFRGIGLTSISSSTRQCDEVLDLRIDPVEISLVI